MSKKRDPIAKVRIQLVDDGARGFLMSRKRKEGKRGHGKLEMLGGHVDEGESPFEALVRELKEEERTGRLAEIVLRREPACASAEIDGAVHYLFELSLDAAECDRLEADPEESLGLERVPAAELESGALDEDLTYRTRLILRGFGPAPETRS